MRRIAAPDTRARVAGRSAPAFAGGSTPHPGSTTATGAGDAASPHALARNGTGPHPGVTGRPAETRGAARARSVLVAVAHPDDETLAMGGTLAWLSQRGDRVTIVCATRGESGWIADPLLATRESLGAMREQELRRAAQVLGVADVCMLDYRDGTLSCVAPAELTGAFAAVIRRARPDVVITWGPDGGYGHPDHIAISAAVTAAFFATAPQPHDPRALYYFAVRQHLLVRGLRWLSHQARRGRAPRPPLRAPRASTEIDVSSFRKTRLEALRQHRTQIPADVWTRGLAALLAPRNNFAFSQVERFHRAYPPLRPGDPLETVFWQRAAGGGATAAATEPAATGGAPAPLP